jgi:AraC-like DNA-binding protein
VRHTTLLRHEFELGYWIRARRAPDPRLRSLLHRDHLGFVQRRPGFTRWLEPPRAALTLMVDLEGGLRADGATLPDAWVSGLGNTYSLVEFGPSYASIDLELTPLGAYRVLGRPLHELAGSVVSLEDLWGPAGRRLAERLRLNPDWDDAFDLIEAFLLSRVAEGPVPTPVVEWAWARLRASAGRVGVEALADEVGCSRRYLQTKFREQVGLPPKTVARLIRFESVCRRLERAPGGWADIAADAGYCDQSHLNRDFRDLAGTTPGDYVSRQIPGGGVVGDELPFVQDGGGQRS